MKENRLTNENLNTNHVYETQRQNGDQGNTPGKAQQVNRKERKINRTIKKFRIKSKNQQEPYNKNKN